MINTISKNNTILFIFVFMLLGCAATKQVKDPNVVGRDGTFIAYANGIIYDTKSGLEWYPGKVVTWRSAKAWVQELSINGGGWRMPTVRELKTFYRNVYNSNKEYNNPLIKKGNWHIWPKEKKGRLVFDFEDGKTTGVIGNFVFQAFAVRSRA